MTSKAFHSHIVYIYMIKDPGYLGRNEKLWSLVVNISMFRLHFWGKYEDIHVRLPFEHLHATITFETARAVTEYSNIDREHACFICVIH
jgi:hypothetical protein